VEGRAEELLPLLADHAEASGWTVVSLFCDALPRSASVTAARIVDGDVASASMFVNVQDSLVVRVQIGLEMPPIDQEGIQRGADVSPPLDRAGTCLDPDFEG